MRVCVNESEDCTTENEVSIAAAALDRSNKSETPEQVSGLMSASGDLKLRALLSEAVLVLWGICTFVCKSAECGPRAIYG